MDYGKTASFIIKAVGDKGNIKSVTHCMTRLRFELKDFSLPNKEEILKSDHVISVIEHGGQYQVVIGNKVSNVHQEVINQLGIKPEEEAVPSSTGEGNLSLFDRFSKIITGIFTPLLGAMAASGTIRALLTILIVANLLSEDSGTYQILFATANAFFYFMPIIIGASAAKYFKLNQYLGILIGAALIYPGLLPFASEGGLNFLSIPVNMMDYTSTVFPVIIATWFAAVVENKVKKWPLGGLRFMIQPAIVMLISVPISLIIIGPIITVLSNFLANIVNSVYHFNPTLAGFVLGGPWILLVMFGLHWAFIPIFINNFALQGYDSMLGLLLANQFAIAGAAFAVGLKTNQSKLRGLAYSTGLTSLIGISEPTIYGVLLPYKKPFIAAIIGGSIGAMLAGALGTTQYAFGGSGLLGIPLIINPAGIDLGFFGGIGSQIIGFVVAFIVTWIWGFKKVDDVAL